MSTTFIIFEERSNGQIQIKPSKYPTTYILDFEGAGQVSYGTNGAPPNKPLPPGRATKVTVDIGSIQIRYEIVQSAKLQWSH